VNPPQNTYGFSESLSGTFTLLNGAITSWNLGGYTGQVGCGGGPGCAVGSSSAFTSTASDSSSIFGYPVYGGSCYLYCTSSATNFEGGIWTMEGGVAAVPEPSTWAMMLIGFVAIGLSVRRPTTLRSRRSNQLSSSRLQPAPVPETPVLVTNFTS
jgi:PEP-CTERM motif